MPGSCVLVTQEGTRPLLVEVQALVDQSSLGNPRRVVLGLEQNRRAMLLAVLHRHFDDQELAELGALAAFFTGFGRMGAVFDTGQPMPVGFRKEDGSRLAPWQVEQPVILR